MAMIDLQSLEPYHLACLAIAVGMLVWDTVEVGRNDAANLVNAVFGARILTRRRAIILAGVAVVCGAVLSSDVIDTARKGIFNPTALDHLNTALAIYVSVYIVDTVLLYSYSAFGMPISTTACLVFELLGASFALQASSVNWGKAGTVISGIVCSIALSGFAAFLIQRAARGAIRGKTSSLGTLLLHGGWVGGGLAAGLVYFLLLKGMKHVPCVHSFNAWLSELDDNADVRISSAVIVLTLWGLFAISIHLALVVFRKRAARLLFPVLAMFGMMAMAFAFGQNDLANCASPGLSAFALISKQNLEIGTEVRISSWMLFVCGFLLLVGMSSKNAERVTKAAVSTGSMGDHVALWAPQWCVRAAEYFLRFRSKAPALAPRASITPAGKTMHYDSLRACVIMSVSASVIATASSLGLPVSTTYVAFAAVVATGMADRIFQRGDAALKLGRAIWVVFSWFASAAIAAIAAGLVALTVHRFHILGMVACILANLAVRQILKRRADLQAQLVKEEAYERAHPERFAQEDEGV
ncbi:MAG: inorganic phosphate transporter [Phycisphaerales bacterium]|nr:MAG: inorganic phosphate transporter [Phycisphaerales bacterium]